jgi:rhodanese-related sulfurtransferase
MRLPVVMAVVLMSCLSGMLAGAATDTDAERLAHIAEMYGEYRRDFTGIADVTADTLSMWLDSGDVILVDVREQAEREVSVIAGAIPAEELDARLDDSPGQKVVVYCTIGYRSGKFARTLQKNGVAAFNLVGGILSWTHAGGVVVHDGEAIIQVHVYGKKWSLLPVGYEAVWK